MTETILAAYPGAVMVVDGDGQAVFCSSTCRDFPPRLGLTGGVAELARIVSDAWQEQRTPAEGLCGREVVVGSAGAERRLLVDIVPLAGRRGRAAVYLRELGEGGGGEPGSAGNQAYGADAFKYILKHDPNAVAVFDKRMNYLMVSDRYLQDYQVCAEGVIGRNHYEVFADIPDRWKEIHRQVLAGEVRRQYDDSFIRQDGSITYTSWECRPWYDRDGDIGGLVMYTEVTTERKEAEFALENSENLLRQLMDSTAEAIVGIDRQGICVFINQSGLDLLGCGSDEEIVGRDFRAIWHPFDENGAELQTPLHQAAGTLREQRRFFSRTTFVKRPDGSAIPVSLRMQPYYLGDTFAGMVATFIDISRQIEAGEERRRLEEQLRQSQKMEAMGRLAGGIAHDFNNILGSIIGYGELVEVFELEDPQEIRRKVAQMLKGAYRAQELVSRILAFSRKVSKDYTTISLTPLIEEVLVILRASLPSTIAIETHLSAQADKVYADATGIFQVLLNLCTNGVDSMRKGGGRLRVGLRELDAAEAQAAALPPSEEEAWLLLEVEDTGSGFQPDEAQRLFEPYYTTKEKGAGTGLGLALAYSIVREHGGVITASSSPGLGSLFRVYLPAGDRREEELAHLLDDYPAPESLTILLAEDEEALLAYSSELLERLGHKVVARSTGDAALEAFLEQPDGYDLVITDETMPGLTGLELTRRIRALREDIPVLLCTGNSRELSLDEIDRAGILGIMEKPVRLRTFKHHIAKAIEVLPQQRRDN